jgi:hypothetical protein
MVEWELFDEHFKSALYLSRKLDSEAFIFLIVGSYGDVFVNCSLLERAAIHHKRKIVALIDKRWSLIALRFSSESVNFILLDNEQQVKNSLMCQGQQYRFKPGFIYPLLSTMHPLLDQFWFNFYATDFEIKKLLLRLPKETSNKIPNIDYLRLAEIKKIFAETGARIGKTCILSFQSNSSPQLPSGVVASIVKIFNKNNIDVLLNAAHTFNQDWIPSEISDIPRVKVPSDAPIEFIELAGYHIGTAHGLTQILANYPTKAKLALIADLSKEFTINNGAELKSEKVLLFGKSAPNDINSSNDYTEFPFTSSNLDTLLKSVEYWISEKNLLNV